MPADRNGDPPACSDGNPCGETGKRKAVEIEGGSAGVEVGSAKKARTATDVAGADHATAAQTAGASAAGAQSGQNPPEQFDTSLLRSCARKQPRFRDARSTPVAV